MVPVYLERSLSIWRVLMTYWKSSQDRLDAPEIDSRLKLLARDVSMNWPFPLWEVQINKNGGYRPPGVQAGLYASGASKVKHSKHEDGEALDFTLYWKGTANAIWDRFSYTVLFGYIWTLAKNIGIPIRWGADWNQNWVIKEEKNWEVDFVHYELGE